MFMRKHTRNQLLEALLGTGLYLLHRKREHEADRISDVAAEILDHFERPSHLKWVLVGAGLGIGFGMLLAPVTGREARENISSRVHDIGGRVRSRFEERKRATGTRGVR
jgi:uncharacterized membrane protein